VIWFITLWPRVCVCVRLVTFTCMCLWSYDRAGMCWPMSVMYRVHQERAVGITPLRWARSARLTIVCWCTGAVIEVSVSIVTAKRISVHTWEANRLRRSKVHEKQEDNREANRLRISMYIRSERAKEKYIPKKQDTWEARRYLRSKQAKDKYVHKKRTG